MGIFDGGGGGFGGNLISNGGGTGFDLGDAVGIGGSFGLNEITTSAQQQAAKQVRRFSKKQRGTAYQVAVQDLKAAGLNPIIAAGATPTSGLGITQAQVSDYAGAVAGGSRAASAAKQQRLSAKLNEQQRKLLGQQANTSSEQANRERATTTLIGKQGDILREQVHSARVRGQFDRSRAGSELLRAQRAAELAASVITSAKAVNPFTNREVRLRY